MEWFFRFALRTTHSEFLERKDSRIVFLGHQESVLVPHRIIKISTKCRVDIGVLSKALSFMEILKRLAFAQITRHRDAQTFNFWIWRFSLFKIARLIFSYP